MRKIVIGICLSVAIMSGAAVFSKEATAQQAYPLTCNSGGRMQGSFSADGTLSLIFAPGKAGTASSWPSPGTCSWRDRGFRNGEPTRLLVRSSVWARHIFSSVVDNVPFEVMVYNNRNGSMMVTGFGAATR